MFRITRHKWCCVRAPKLTGSVDVKAQIAGRIVDVPGGEGEIIKADQTICQIDAEDRQRRLQHARAALNQADIEYRGVQKLKQGGYQSELAIAQARTRLESARAVVERSSLDIANLSVKAPFDGVVERRPAEVGRLCAARAALCSGRGTQSFKN